MTVISARLTRPYTEHVGAHRIVRRLHQSACRAWNSPRCQTPRWGAGVLRPSEQPSATAYIRSSRAMQAPGRDARSKPQDAQRWQRQCLRCGVMEGEPGEVLSLD